MQVEFRLLGPVEADVDGRPVELGGPKERALLALLLLHANEVVSRDVLADQLWVRPPTGAVHALEARVSELRKRLGRPVIGTKAGGYRIEVDPGSLDVDRFDGLVRAGREALAAGDPGGAERLLSEALALWRGPPLADIAYEPIALAEAGRLDEQRLGALETRAEARLSLGRDGELVPELDALVEQHPLRERLRGLLMHALYRAGRQAEALAVYTSGRRLLVDELGIEPGRELQDLQESILRHDPRLDPAPPPDVVPAVSRREPAEVPQRKVVTVLFCDVADSTALGERLDPEALRTVLDRYFERMQAIVEYHGGTVEKFVGDAVMAVFGVPLLHDDDALRACRAACEMRDALPELGVEARIGIATGEVLTGAEQSFATGTAVNLAARLEQAAAVGEVLADGPTVAVACAAASVEELGPLELKGVSRQVPAFRLVRATAAAPPRAVRAPFIGRATELRRLHDALSQAVADRSCQLFTLLGPPGIGKSRLAQEFLAQVDAGVVRGRCLSYGDGITYAPVAEVVHQLGSRTEDPGVDAAIGSLLRESQRPTSPEEIAWAFRKTLESAAVAGPLVCLFDDLHWAEPPLLDLVEHVADLSRGAPILLLCLARPELHERRPGWAGGKLNATTLLLAPLTADESRRLLDELDGDVGQLRDRIVEVAEGNPLFLEELLALARESDGAELAVPPTIHALLSARLDRVDAAERTLLECAAVEGKDFDRPALEALSPDLPDVRSRLEALVRRDLIRPVAGDEDAFSFRHQLIRDTAYNALPKGVRADLHRRLGSWLADHASALVEADEVVGYHLEQACTYTRELGRLPDPLLLAEARGRLLAAGRRAFRARDHASAAKLLHRAAELGSDALDLALELDLTMSLFYAGEVSAALERVARDTELAAVARDRRGELTLRLWRGFVEVFLARGTADLEVLLAEAMPEFCASGDDIGSFAGGIAAWFVANAHGRPDDAVQSAESALEHARRAGLAHYDSILVPSAGLSRWYGACPCSELLRWVHAQEWGGEGQLFSRLLEGVSLAMLGRSQEALAVVGDAGGDAADRVSIFVQALVNGFMIDLLLLTGDAAGAADHAERACRLSERMGERANHAGYLLQNAEALRRLGRLDEAGAALRRAAGIGRVDDPANVALERVVEAGILIARGAYLEASVAARESAAVADTTQYLSLQGDAHLTFGDALAHGGDRDGARRELEAALRLYRQKEHLVGVAQARRVLASLEETR